MKLEDAPLGHPPEDKVKASLRKLHDLAEDYGDVGDNNTASLKNGSDSSSSDKKKAGP